MMNNVKMGIACALVLTLTACGGSSGSKSSSSSTSTGNSSSLSSTQSSNTSAAESSSSTITSSVSTSSSSSEESSSSTGNSSSSSSESSNAGDSSTSASSSSAAAEVQSGVFIDSAVAGVRYQTAPSGQEGFTSANGEYQFVAGDTVTFSIGDLAFPPVTAKGVVTPVDMTDSADPQDQVVINIAALLQSLDTDGNPANGITVDYAAAALVAQPISFDQPYANFAASAAVTNLVANSGSDNTTLVTAEAAAAHLQASLNDIEAAALVGTWYVSGQGYHYVLTVLDDSTYATIDYDIGGAAGVIEYGTYAWNQTDGKLTVQTELTSATGELDAMPPFANQNTLVLNGDTLSLTDADETFTLSRLNPSETHPLKGGWSFSEEDDGLVAFAFTESNYFMGQLGEADEVGGSGIEFGTYTYDLESHAITVATLFDTNGQWGLSHPCAVLDKEMSNDLSCGPDGRDIVQTITLDGSIATFVSEADTIANNGEEDPVQLYRVEDVIDGSIRLRLALTLEVTEYQPGEFYEIFDEMGNLRASMQCNRYEEIQVGDTESFNETWYLSQKAGTLSRVGDVMAEFNPVTNTITYNQTEGWAPVQCDTGDCSAFSESVTDKLELVFHPGETPAITGTYTEDRQLGWTFDQRVSRCVSTYQVIGTLR